MKYRNSKGEIKVHVIKLSVNRRYYFPTGNIGKFYSSGVVCLQIRPRKSRFHPPTGSKNICRLCP
uniref:Mpv17-like protein n=1 Tax=Parascaris univalens TaxID=6257 RepID=A0A915AWC6_PARUN